MAYRFDTGIARSLDASNLGSINANNFRVDLDGGSFAASLSRTISPTSISHTRGPQDFAASPSATFGFKGHTIGDGPMTNTPPIGGDDVPDDNTSTVGMNVQEGQVIASSINHPLDQDWFVMTLDAGDSYDFTMTPADTTGSGPDFKLQIYDADGNLVVESDSGGFGEGETLSYSATASGTYYVAVAAFTPADIGDYTLAGQINDDPSDPGGTPLDAIDWGGVTVDYVDTIKVYYALPGEVYGSVDDPLVSVGWDAFAKDATFVAFDQYEHIINVQFEEVGTAAEADFILLQDVTAPALLGSMRPPGEANEGVGEFNKAAIGYTEASVQQGGYHFITFIHEFGHGMGMAHPHDTGGGSEVMHGVEGDIASGYTTGDFGLNQGIYTTMTYNDGWPDGPEGTSDSDDYGYQGTMMALDVALLQQKYGANMDYNTGDDTYLMPDVNAPGTFYACIWDAGGKDTIRAQGSETSTIDLRAATLEYEEGGGGWVSHTNGIFGGFTIANGAMIENARGAKGDDSLTGNGADNKLTGGKGADTINGGAGEDKIDGGGGIDQLTGGGGDDIFVFNEGDTHRKKVDVIGDLTDDDIVDLSAIDADTSSGGDDAFFVVGSFSGTAGELVLAYNGGLDITLFRMDNDGDGRSDMVISVAGNHADYNNFDL
jgi:Ca2+-binding RTX toxin-like protein